MTEKEIQNAKENKPIPNWAIWVTIIWLVIWSTFGIYNGILQDLDKLGSFLSGVFAPLAWFWFIVSYLLQREELQLQRKELKLQREANQDMALAQQQSKDEFEKQSKALQTQLEITQQQFEIHKKEMDGKKPNFILFYQQDLYLHAAKMIGNTIMGDDSFEYSSEDMKLEDYKYIECRDFFSIKNIAGDATIKEVKLINNPSDDLYKLSYELSHNSADSYNFSIIITNDKEFTKMSSHQLLDYFTELAKSYTLEIHYSYSDSSSSDEYTLLFEDGKRTLVKT